jgi:hypothetical protein
MNHRQGPMHNFRPAVDITIVAIYGEKNDREIFNNF